jgi:hypothetical protein
MINMKTSYLWPLTIVLDNCSSIFMRIIYLPRQWRLSYTPNAVTVKFGDLIGYALFGKAVF